MANKYNEGTVKNLLMDEFGVPMDYEVDVPQPEVHVQERRERGPRNKIFDAIKAQFGESVAQKARGRGYLQIPNIIELLRYAGKDLEVLFPYLDDMLRVHNITATDTLDPIELLDRAGYKAWYVTNMKDQNKIAGYFRDTRAVKYGYTDGNPRSDFGEMICTVYNGLESGDKRYKDGWHVIHAVKKEIWGDDKLPEEEWHIKPAKRGEESVDDDYSKSVISIQVSPSENRVKIPQRYNHTLPAADGGWHLNLDAIQPGLTAALEHRYNVKLRRSKAYLPDYYVHVGDRTQNKDRIIKYNREINGVYIGDNFWCSDGDVKPFSPYQALLLPKMDLVIDVKKGKVESIAGAHVQLAQALTNILQSCINADGTKTQKIKFDGKRIVVEGKNKENEKEKSIVAEIEDDKFKYLNCMNVEEISLLSDAPFSFGAKIDCQNVKILNIKRGCLPAYAKLTLNPNADMITINADDNQRVQLQNADLSNVRHLSLENFDFPYGVKLNPNADVITLDDCSGISGNIDLSNVASVNLVRVDLKDANIKLNPHADNIELVSCKNINGICDFSDVKSVALRYVSFKAADVNFGEADEVLLDDIEGLKGNIDFCGVTDLDIRNINWSRSDVNSIKLKKSTFMTMKSFSGILDLSAVPDGERFTNRSGFIDLSNLKDLKLNPNAIYDFCGAKIKVSDIKSFKNMHNVRFSENLTVRDVTKSEQCDLSGLKRINPRVLTIIGKWNQKNYLTGDLDFTREKNIELINFDLGKAKVKFSDSENDGRVSLKWVTGLQGTHDINIGYFDNCDLTNAYINAYCFGRNITNVNGLNGNFVSCNRANFAGTTFQKTAKLDSQSGDTGMDLTATKGLTGEFDLHNSEVVNADLSNVKFVGKLPTNLSGCKLGGIVLNYPSGSVELSGADLTNVKSIVLGRGVYAHCSGAVGLRGEHDFRECSNINLENADFPDATIRIALSVAFRSMSDRVCNLSGARGTFIIYPDKFSGDDYSIFNGHNSSNMMDLSKATIVFDKSVKMFKARCVIGPKGTLDLQNIKSIELRNSDFSNTDIIFNSNASRIDLTGPLKGLKGELDFSGVGKLCIDDSVDLSNVTSIKIGPSTKLDFDRNVDVSKIHKISFVHNVVNKGAEKIASFKKAIGSVHSKIKQKTFKQDQSDDRDM